MFLGACLRLASRLRYSILCIPYYEKPLVRVLVRPNPAAEIYFRRFKIEMGGSDLRKA